MSYALSRVMSAATATYAGYCFARPGHLGQVLGAGKGEQGAYETLALVVGVRDATISTFGVLGSERTVRTAMWVRVLCDVGDGVVLAARADDDETRATVLGVALGWGALNLLALQLDKRRARRAAAAGTTAAETVAAVRTLTDRAG